MGSAFYHSDGSASLVGLGDQIRLRLPQAGKTSQLETGLLEIENGNPPYLHLGSVTLGTMVFKTST